MSFKIKKAEHMEHSTLYARHITKKNIDYINQQTEELGFSHKGDYINAVFDEIRRINDAEGIEVRPKSRRKNKKTG